MGTSNYQELIAWQKAMDLVESVYRLSAKFPADEMFGLRSQVRRAAVSVPSNIAEGHGRGKGAEFAHHLRIAKGSRQELETQLLIAARLGFVTDAQLQRVLPVSYEVGRLISGLYRAIDATSKQNG